MLVVVGVGFPMLVVIDSTYPVLFKNTQLLSTQWEPRLIAMGGCTDHDNPD
jgi:hypothetical protein